MGANSSGKTTFGQVLMRTFNYIKKENSDFLTEMSNDQGSYLEIYFVIDDILYSFLVPSYC